MRSKFSTLSTWLTLGRKGDATLRCSSRPQLMDLKKGCALMSALPAGPYPRRLVGSFWSRALTRLAAGVLR